MSHYRIEKFLVEFWSSDCVVGYNCGLGTAAARSYALATARAYGGEVIAQYADGSTESLDTRMGTPVLGESAKVA